MNANGSTGTNEFRALSAVELDAVSGGEYHVMFGFAVAGMIISGGYDSQGRYDVTVESGKTIIAQGGKV